ncbi:MAG: lactate racemase domain-containing protein [Desulfobacterales bacterium]
MSNTHSVTVPTRAWHGDVPVELAFPEKWDVVSCEMKGHHAPELSEDDIRKAFAEPIGTKPVRKLAAERNEVAIIIDDMTRPTRMDRIVPILLEELKAGGIEDDCIRFVMALGAHGAYTRTDFVKKLGEAVVAQYPVYNHNVYENCTLMGKTTRATRVFINAEVAKCDLKIGLGSIVPHLYTGFGGGAKILLPGVCSMETIEANHESLRYTAMQTSLGAEIALGKYKQNVMRLDMVEAARIAGMDLIVNSLVNCRRQNTALFVGDVEEAYLAGAAKAESHYATQIRSDADVIVANCYAKGSEALLSLPACLPFFFMPPQKDFVMIVSAPEGQVTHYIYGVFGKTIGGRHYQELPAVSNIPGLNRMIIYAPLGDKAGEQWLGLKESETIRDWQSVIDRLTQTHGDSAKVVVIPDATIQYFPEGKNDPVSQALNE